MAKPKPPASYAFRTNPHQPYDAGPMKAGKPQGIVLHIVTGVKDYEGLDGAAEAMATNWATQSKSSSWHDLIDSDSHVPCLPPTWKAWHCRFGVWERTIGIEIATDLTDWTKKPTAWVDGCLTQLARLCAKYVRDYGIPVTLIRNRTKALADLAAGKQVGFMYHADLDPTRRTDPGISGGRDTFPWAAFEKKLRAELGQSTPAPAKPKPTTPAKPQPTTLIPTRVLKVGTAGADVRWLQTGLKARYSYADLATDGVFGRATRDAVKEWQHRVGLTPDGTFGPASLKAARKAWNQ